MIHADQDPDLIHCRGKITTRCEDGTREPSWRNDGTYRRDNDSVCCTACYAALGCPDRRYVDAAIHAFWER